MSVRGRRGDDLLAGLLVVGLAVGNAADLDVEHMDLAVDGEVLAVSADQDRGVEGLAFRAPLGDAAGEQVDAQLAGPAAGSAEAGPVERLGPGEQLFPTREQVPLLGQGEQLRSLGGGDPHEPLGGSRFRDLSPVELSCTTAARKGLLSAPWLTDQSIGLVSISAGVRGRPGARRVRLASAGPSGARTQGGRIVGTIRPTEDAAPRRSAAGQTCAGSPRTTSKLRWHE